EVAPAELVHHPHLGRSRITPDLVHLELVRDDDAAPVHLDIGERIADVDVGGNVHVGAQHRVGVDQDRRGHARNLATPAPARAYAGAGSASRTPGVDREARRVMSVSFPGESSEYRAARDRLLEQEIDLRRAMEAVAAARRALPPGGGVPEDYVFQGGGAGGTPIDLRLSDLFAPGKDS